MGTGFWLGVRTGFAGRGDAAQWGGRLGWRIVLERLRVRVGQRVSGRGSQAEWRVGSGLGFGEWASLRFWTVRRPVCAMVRASTMVRSGDVEREKERMLLDTLPAEGDV